MILQVIRFCMPWRIGLRMLALMVIPLVAVAMVAGTGIPLIASGVPVFLILVGLAGPARRATLFEAGLPVSGRQWFVVRAAYRLILIWVPAVICLAFAQKRADSALVADVLGVAALATLAILLPNAIRPRELAASGTVLECAWIGIAGSGALAWYLLPAPDALLLFIAAIVVISLMAWSVTPASYQTAPIAAKRSTRWPISAFVRRDVPDATRAPLWPVLRSVFSWRWLGILGFMALCASSGGFDLLVGIAGFVPQAAVHLHRDTRWIAGLPMSRRALLFITLLATVVPAVGGMAIGLYARRSWVWESHLAYLSGPEPFRDLDAFDRGKSKATNVPLAFWRVAPDRVAPVIRSPTGESVVPTTIPMLGFALYNPYFTGATSTNDFQAWQFQRATNAVYGHPIAFEDRDGNRPVGPQVTEQPRMLILSGAVILMLLLGALFVIELRNWHWLHRPSARALRILVTGLWAGPIATMFAVDLWFQITYLTGSFTSLIQVLLLRASQVLPHDLFALVAIAAVPVLALYWLLERQFGKSEFTSQAQPRVTS